MPSPALDTRRPDRNRHRIRDALDVDDVTAMAGSAAAREAIREGANAEWSGRRELGEPKPKIRSLRQAVSASAEPCAIDFQFATCTATASGIAAADRARVTAWGSNTAEHGRHRRLRLRVEFIKRSFGGTSK